MRESSYPVPAAPSARLTLFRQSVIRPVRELYGREIRPEWFHPGRPVRRFPREALSREKVDVATASPVIPSVPVHGEADNQKFAAAMDDRESYAVIITRATVVGLEDQRSIALAFERVNTGSPCRIDDVFVEKRGLARKIELFIPTAE